MKRVALVGTVCCLLALASPAAAKSMTDPDDMTSPLDIRKMVYVDEGGQVGTLKLVSEEDWRCSYLVPNLNTLKWYFDGQADGDVDLIGKFKCVKTGQGKALYLFLHGKQTGNNYEPVKAKRPDKRSAEATFSFDLVELNGEHLKLYAQVKDGAAEGCTSANKCFDRAPDTGKWMVY